MEFLFIDTESCTGRDNDGSLCSFGYAICDENFNLIEQRDILFNPLPSRFAVGDVKHAKQTGITFAYTVEQFRSSPRFSEKYDEIKKLFENRIVVGFAMINDVKYINDACKKFSLPIINYKFLDVQFVYKLIYPEETAIGLKTLNEKYGNVYNAHRSDADALATATLFKTFLNESGFTLSSVMEKYGIYLGQNDDDGYFLNYADAIIKGKFGLKISKKVQSAIYSDFADSLTLSSNKTTVCFSHKIERKDADYLRTMINLLLNNKMGFTRERENCSVFIHENGEETKNLADGIKLMKLSDLEIKLGYTENMSFNDEAFLYDYFSKKISI